MFFWKLLGIFTIVAFVAAIFFGPAIAIFLGILFAIGLEVYSEVHQMKTPEGRNQIHQEIQREKEIEEYWGIIDYDEKD